MEGLRAFTSSATERTKPSTKSLQHTFTYHCTDENREELLLATELIEQR